MPPDISAKRPRTVRSQTSSFSSIDTDLPTTSTTLTKGLVELSDEYKTRANAHSPLSDAELDDIVDSLKNIAPETCREIDWEKLRFLLSQVAHLPHKDWGRTAESAKALRDILLPNDEGLTDTFRCMFERVLKEGNWDRAAFHAIEKGSECKPWAVLVTGVNGIRKTTSVYQPWFNDLLSEALISPVNGRALIKGQPLPTGNNSFFRQLDHMIVTLTNENFQRLYALTAEANERGVGDRLDPTAPSAKEINDYSNHKAALFARFRTISEILGVVLVREAQALSSNVMVETSGRDIAMFHYVDRFFPSDKYNKLVLHFDINDLSYAEKSVDGRMVREMKDGINALREGDVREVIRANAGGPYGSEVLKGVQSDSDRVWNEVIMQENADGVGCDWFKASIAIEANPTKPWTARAIRPDGTPGKVFTFEAPS